jgi:hypothetical protein
VDPVARPCYHSNVPCPTADSPFEKFAEATHEHFDATDNLSMLTGQQQLGVTDVAMESTGIE